MLALFPGIHNKRAPLNRQGKEVSEKGEKSLDHMEGPATLIA